VIIDAKVPTRGPNDLTLFVASDGVDSVKAVIAQEDEQTPQPIPLDSVGRNSAVNLQSIHIDGLVPATNYRILIWQNDSKNELRTSTLRKIESAHLFRFGILSDPHCSVRDDIGRGGRLFRYSFQLLETSLHQLHRKNVEFVAIPGDLVNSCVDEEIREAKRIIEVSPVPCRVLVGNHESRSKEFIEAFGLPTCGYYSFNHKSIHFICIHTKTPDDLLPDRAQYRWLINELAEHQDTTTIIFSHYCLGDVPYIAREKDCHVTNVKEISALLRSHPQVKAVFAGHKNMPSLRMDGHVAHVVCPQVVVYDTAYDVVDVHESGCMRRVFEIDELDLLWCSRELTVESNRVYRFGREEARNFVLDW